VIVQRMRDDSPVQVVIGLTEDEARDVVLIMGSILGSGPVRDTSDGIYDRLRAIDVAPDMPRARVETLLRLHPL